MSKFLKRDLATSLTTFTFLVIAVSGVMMFFHFFDQYVENLHEIVGLFFVAVVLFHVFYNFKSMKNYFTKKVFGFSALSIAIVSLAFVLSVEDGPDTKKVMIMSMFNTPIENSLKVLEKDFLEVKDRFQSKGITINDGATIGSIADANKISPFEVIGIIIQK